MSQAETNILRQAVTNFSNNYNVESDIVQAAMLGTGSRIPGGQSAQVQEIAQPIFHVRDHVSGSQAAAAEYQFFNETNPLYTNLPNGVIPAQQIFAIENIGVDLITGVDRTGTAGGTAAASFSAAAATASIVAAEAKRVIMETSLLELKIGTKVLLTAPLTFFPLGAGLDALMVATYAATNGSVYATNGVPHAGNRRLIGSTPELIMPGQQIIPRIILQSATVASLGANVFAHWKLALFGRFFRK